MSLYISILLLLLAVVLCAKSHWISPRIYYLFGALGWGGFLLTFYMNVMIRVAIKQAGPVTTKADFVAGILAYENVLWEVKLSLGLLLLSLALLIFFPVKAANGRKMQ